MKRTPTATMPMIASALILQDTLAVTAAVLRAMRQRLVVGIAEAQLDQKPTRF
jgi:hypothetical protein